MKDERKEKMVGWEFKRSYGINSSLASASRGCESK